MLIIFVYFYFSKRKLPKFWKDMRMNSIVEYFFSFLTSISISFNFINFFNYSLSHICGKGKYQTNDGGISCVECPTAKYIIDDAKSAVLHDRIDDCTGCPVGYEFQGSGLECLICSSVRSLFISSSQTTEVSIRT